MSGKYGAPMEISDRRVVRIRRVSIQRDFAGMTWIGFRLTHPHGRRSLTSTDFPIREAAARYAQEKGWTVIGSQS